jgi:2,3-dihydroxyphenylpropionate 1,2-dioxygenase
LNERISMLKSVCLSHTPLRGLLDPQPGVIAEIDAAIESARQKVRDFDPELVIMFAPDHFNGFFYDLMPPFCVGTAAEAIGDFGTPAGEISVATELAGQCAAFLIKDGLDVAVSHRMRVDHGFANPLQDLWGRLDEVPLIPIFINSVAPPLPTFARVRALGEAVGRFAESTAKRVLLLGSGGLSHEPPVPKFAGASEEVAERLIAGRNPTEQVTKARLERLMKAARLLAAGDEQVKPLNPEWDRDFLDLVRDGRWAECDRWDDETISQQAGNSAHEVRTWIAALAAVGSVSKPRTEVLYYRPVPEWIAGFGMAWAETDAAISA